MKLVFKFLVLSAAVCFSSVVNANSINYDDAVKLKRDGKVAEAEAAFAALAKSDSNNVLVLEQLAVVQSWQQKFDESITTYRLALKVKPAYTSARAGLARVLYWNKQRDEALKEMELVIQERPNSVSYHTLLGDILVADGQYKAARKAYKRAQELEKGKPNKELATKIKRAVGPKKWRIDAGFLDESYSRNRVDGDSSFVQLGYTFDNRSTLYVRGEDYSSFGSSDSGITIGAYFSPIKKVLINAEHYDTSDAEDFRPIYQSTIVSEFYFHKRWQPLLGYRIARFNDENGGERNVTTITPGIRYNFSRYGIEYKRARTENVDDSITSSDTLKFTAQFSRFSPYAFIVDGEEGVPPLTPAEIRIVGLGSSFKVNNSFSFRVDLSQEDRNDVYIANFIGAGISLFF